MKVKQVIWAGVLLGVVFAARAHAAEFNLAVSAGGVIPIGDFAKTTGMIEPIPDSDTYSVLGGAAEGGFGFNVEIEVGLSQRILVGGEFGYSRHNADATDLVENAMPAFTDFVKNVDATWAFSSLGCFARVIVLKTPVIDLYGRVGAGVAKVKNTVDVTLDIPLVGETAFTSDFPLGNRLYVTSGIGGEYRLREWVSLVGELTFKHVHTGGAEATAVFYEWEVTGVEDFHTRTLRVTGGLRFPISGL